MALLVLAFLLCGQNGEDEAMLHRIERFELHLEDLLGMYHDLTICDKPQCFQEIRKKYFLNSQNGWEEKMLGTRNTLLDLKILLLKKVISQYREEIKKHPHDPKLKQQLKSYEELYGQLLEHPGYD